jgi:hypothetical protein
MRLGAYQIAYTSVPAHAAVGETVGLVGPRERGFVNAVLRRLANDPPPPAQGDHDDAVSLRTGLVTWAVRELRRLVGDETEAAAAAFAERARLCIRVNGPRVEVGSLIRRCAPMAATRGHRRSIPTASCSTEGSTHPSRFPGRVVRHPGPCLGLRRARPRPRPGESASRTSAPPGWEDAARGGARGRLRARCSRPIRTSGASG